MPEYFRYAERDINREVDWSEIGRNTVDWLNAERKRRDDEKAAIAKQTQEDITTITQVPQGEKESLNQMALRFSGDVQRARLMDERLLKKGILDPKDYTIRRQNLMDGTNELFQVVKDGQTVWAEGLKRYNNLESAKQEQYMLGLLELFSDLTQTNVMIDPKDMTVSVASRKDGKIQQHMPVSYLRGMMNTKIDRFDTEGSLKKVAASLGTYIDATLIPKGLKSIEDAKLNPDYQAIESDLLNMLMTNPTNVGSILTDWVGSDPNAQMYTFTRDDVEAEANPHMILLKPRNGSGPLEPDFTTENGKKQFKYAKDRMIDRLRSLLDVKEEVEQKFAPQPQQAWQHVAAGVKKTEAQAATMLAQLYYGTDAQIEESLQYFGGLDPNITSMERTPDGVSVTYADGREALVKFKTGNQLMTQSGFVGSATELSGQIDVNTALKTAGINPKAPFNATGKGTYSATAAPAKGTPKPATAQSIASTKMLVPDAKGKLQPVGVLTNYDNIMKNATGRDHTIAEVYASALQSSFETLPADVTEGMEITTIDGGDLPESIQNLSGSSDAVTEIYIPKLMTSPIFVPADESGGMKTYMKMILSNIYDAAKSGKMVTPSDLSKYFEKGQFAKYNNGIMYNAVNFTGNPNVSASQF